MCSMCSKTIFEADGGGLLFLDLNLNNVWIISRCLNKSGNCLQGTAARMSGECW